ncbi:hypothetical protein A5645_21925 [Mycobacterium asiaticum]|uniref:hypothetical protein n=1 Tax=Mycobacterium asiaticum TaxID=1790 RepID=UPI0007EFEE99|nr:hypothetical protein [Mycobacterium asiaticum]OBK93012.1 hypothetical protein A5645_21925 [Mycobacterium asiaticum]
MIKRILVVSAALAVTLAGLMTAPPAAVADTYCGKSSRGASVYAGNSDTSCQFALSTAEAYHAYGNGSQPFDVKSPVTGQTYSMTCTAAGSVCQGGNNALVYLR